MQRISYLSPKEFSLSIIAKYEGQSDDYSSIVQLKSPIFQLNTVSELYAYKLSEALSFKVALED